MPGSMTKPRTRHALHAVPAQTSHRREVSGERSFPATALPMTVTPHVVTERGRLAGGGARSRRYGVFSTFDVDGTRCRISGCSSQVFSRLGFALIGVGLVCGGVARALRQGVLCQRAGQPVQHEVAGPEVGGAGPDLPARDELHSGPRG